MLKGQLNQKELENPVKFKEDYPFWFSGESMNKKQAESRNPYDGEILPEQILIETYLTLKGQPVLTGDQQTELLKLEEEIKRRGIQVPGLTPPKEMLIQNDNVPTIQLNIENMIVHKTAGYLADILLLVQSWGEDNPEDIKQRADTELIQGKIKQEQRDFIYQYVDDIQEQLHSAYASVKKDEKGTPGSPRRDYESGELKKIGAISDVNVFDLQLLKVAVDKVAKAVQNCDDPDVFYYYKFITDWIKNVEDKTQKAQVSQEQLNYDHGDISTLQI